MIKKIFKLRLLYFYKSVKLTDISDSVDEDEPPSGLLELGNFLKKKFDIKRYSVKIDDYFQCVDICRRGKPGVVFLLFTVYSDREVADNTEGAASLGHIACARNVKSMLERMGYNSFHNSYSEYVKKRREEIR